MLFVNVAASQGILAPSILKQASATDGQCLTWSSSNSQWEPADCSDSSINIEENNVEVIAAENLTGIDFLGADFDVTDDANEANIAIAAAITRDAEVGALAAAAASVTAGAGAVPKGDDSPGRLDISWLASGTPDGSQFVRDDRTLAQVAFSQLTGTASDSQVPDTITLTSIGQAGDVDLTGIADGECLVYDGVTDNRLEPGACGGGINVEENNVEVVAAADLTGIDFLGADFDVTNSANEADVSIAAGITRDSEWDSVAEIEAATGYDFSDAANLTGDVPTAAMSANVLAAVGGGLVNGRVPFVSGGALTDSADLSFDAGTTELRIGSGSTGRLAVAGFDFYRAASSLWVGQGANDVNVYPDILGIGTDYKIFLANDGSGASLNLRVGGPTSSYTLATFGGSQSFLCQDQTATTGDTLCVFKGGAGESGNVFEVRPFGSDTPNAAITAAGKATVTSLKINDGGTRPTCDASTRFTFWADEGGAGVKDDVSVCAKDAGDAYAWRSIY